MANAAFRRISGFSSYLLVLALWLLAWGVLHGYLSSQPVPWLRDWSSVVATAFVGASVWLGWAIRQAWVYPRRLLKAEALWNGGGYASEVVDQLSDVYLATGELGFRVWLLRSRANAALGYKNLAWVESEEAHLARVPFWLRPFLRRFLRALPERRNLDVEKTGRLWLRLLPAMPSLKWRLAIRFLHQDQPTFRVRAWELLLQALPHAAEDPVLLEDLMLALLGRLQDLEREPRALGPQPGEPELQAAFERVLDLLLHRHGQLRNGWDRVAPAMHLLHRGRHDEVLALGHTLPPDRYPEALWVALVAACKGLGDQEGAWTLTGRALAYQPESFRLWMMREDLALELHRNPEALEALERARTLFTDGAPVEPLREWHVRRAEYAYWVEKDPEEAARHLDFLPQGEDAEGRAPLRLLILLDQGRYEEVHREVEPLLERSPANADLQLIQAESLAGMEAWGPLQELLDSLGDAVRQHADFWHLRGIARSHLGNLLGSREDLERAVQLEPDNLRFALDAGHACADLGEWERSEYHWRLALRHDERSEEALTQLAEARRTLHDIEGSKRLLRECLLHHPESESAQVMLAELEAN